MPRIIAFSCPALGPAFFCTHFNSPNAVGEMAYSMPTIFSLRRMKVHILDLGLICYSQCGFLRYETRKQDLLDPLNPTSYPDVFEKFVLHELMPHQAPVV